MEKKPFWKRVNRGFLVSLVLLAAVVVYVLATQLMLLPARQELRQLADDFNQTLQAYSVPSDDAWNQLKTDAGVKEAQAAAAQALKPLFVSDADYLNAAAEQVVGGLVDEEYTPRITAQTLTDSKLEGCTISDDIATVNMQYTYQTDGRFYDYNTGSLADQTGRTQNLYITLICQKIGDDWKIYRVSSVSRSYYTSNYSVYISAKEVG